MSYRCSGIVEFVLFRNVGIYLNLYLCLVLGLDGIAVTCHSTSISPYVGHAIFLCISCDLLCSRFTCCCWCFVAVGIGFGVDAVAMLFGFVACFSMHRIHEYCSFVLMVVLVVALVVVIVSAVTASAANWPASATCSSQHYQPSWYWPWMAHAWSHTTYAIPTPSRSMCPYNS